MPKLHFTKEKMPTPEEFRKLLAEAMTQNNPVEELLQLFRELLEYEKKYGMTSQEFYEKYKRGEMGDEADIISWAITYHSFIECKELIEAALIREAVWHQAGVVSAP
ncbi:MAG: hypothetical protein ACUVV0_08930 [Anaerolineae bacterium]